MGITLKCIYSNNVFMPVSINCKSEFNPILPAKNHNQTVNPRADRLLVF